MSNKPVSFLVSAMLLFCGMRARDVCAQSAALQQRAIFVEYGGPSALLSVNFDTRFNKLQHGGWGVRLGVGYLPDGAQQRFSIPAQLNYLFGKKQHFFEAGAGVTYFHTNYAGSIWGVDSNTGSTVFATLSVGYRYQPIRRGLFAGVGATGLWGSFLPVVIPGISLGYAF